MSLKTRLRISIVAFAAAVVIALSALYLYDFGTLAFEGAHARAIIVGDEVRDYVSERVAEDIGARALHPATVEEFRDAATDIVRSDPRIAKKLQESRASYDAVLNIEIVGKEGVLAAAESAPEGGLPVYHFEDLQKRNAFLNLWDLFFRRQDYATRIPVSVLGREHSAPPIFTIEVLIRSVLLSRVLEPAFYRLAAGFFSALAGAMFLGALLPNLFLLPLERVSRRIESISSGDAADPDPAARSESVEFAAVQSKLNVLGQQFRGVRQDAMELRRNIEQLLQRLEEAVLLFDSGGHLMMAGRSVERLLGRTPQELLGRTVEQVFTAGRNGTEIADAVRLRRVWRDHVVMVTSAEANQIRALVSVEPLENPAGGNIGTLITLRDADSRRQLEAQLDISSRLAALSRLTSGVAHEIKNPLNAMALHLEVLKSRLEEAQPEVEVISREIKRLDHVVKTFLNFNKPLEMKMDSMSLTALAADVAMLVTPDAKMKGIVVETDLSGEAWIGGDRDLIQQAVLNVVVNAIEAMKGGGHLRIATNVVDGESNVTVTDDGPGIPNNVRDKIFNLYFSTKEQGSGIGLAMTFRVIQMHGGTIDFVSEPDRGTSFHLRFPRLTGHGDEPLSRAAGSGRKI
ncbi:MAG: ATP-binding protein [Bryobacteraceae bacterium]